MNRDTRRAPPLWLVPVLSLLLTPLAAAGQASPWRVSAGGGVGVGLGSHDLSRDGAVVAVARASVERRVGGVRLGLQWIGSWMEGAPGGDSRHLVGPVVVVPLGQTPLLVRVGAGLGLATVADADFPPPDGPPGDGVVSVGSYGAAGAGVDLTTAWGLAPGVFLEPSLLVIGVRAGGRTLGVAGATLRLSVALH